jgi:hypothetical protein
MQITHFVFKAFVLASLTVAGVATKASIRPKLRGSLSRNTRKAQFGGGTVQGGSETSGAASNEGQVDSSGAALTTAATAAGDGKFDIKSGGSGSTGFNNLASAGGLGSGLATVKSNGLNDAIGRTLPGSTDIVTSNQAATATWRRVRQCNKHLRRSWRAWFGSNERRRQ